MPHRGAVRLEGVVAAVGAEVGCGTQVASKCSGMRQSFALAQATT
jgi:hypothetical protein